VRKGIVVTALIDGTILAYPEKLAEIAWGFEGG
jgi:hypothetical protein